MMESKHAKASKADTGKTLRRYHAVQANEEFRYGIGKSSLGLILVASSEKGVVSILIGEGIDRLLRDLRRRFPKAHLVREDSASADLLRDVVNFIEAPVNGLDLPLDVRGTDFQKKVWKALRKVPVGKTTTYTDIARAIGSPKAVRAVGHACSLNNLAVAVPCHRVLHKDGSLSGGYHWGNERQKALIERERAAGNRKAPIPHKSF